MKESCEKLKFDIEDNIEVLDPKNRKFVDAKREDEIFVCFNEISALDAISAKRRAEYRLNRIVSLFTFFHHKEVPSWSKDALIVSDSIEIHVNTSVSPMVKIADAKPRDAAIHLNFVAQNLRFNDRSMRKFTRAIDLHCQAISSNVVENQVLNTWIALETMIDNEDSQPRIVHITNALIPFINLFYLRDIFQYIARSIRRYDVKKFGEIINFMRNDIQDLQSKDETALVALFVVGKEYEDLRKGFYAQLTNFPLLRYRIWTLNKALSNSEKIRNFVDSHSKKVTWHIRRIYRARNLIVHEGTIDKNINILAENLHSYVDSFMLGMIELSASQKHITSVEQGMEEARLIFTHWKKCLESEIIEDVSKSNYKLLLFGE